MFTLCVCLQDQQRQVSEHCVNAEPHHGELWCRVSKDIKNWRMKTPELLPLVAAAVTIPNWTVATAAGDNVDNSNNTADRLVHLLENITDVFVMCFSEQWWCVWSDDMFKKIIMTRLRWLYWCVKCFVLSRTEEIFLVQKPWVDKNDLEEERESTNNRSKRNNNIRFITLNHNKHLNVTINTAVILCVPATQALDPSNKQLLHNALQSWYFDNILTTVR